MSKPTRTGFPAKRIVTSFLLLLILIGSLISSASLLGSIITPQQAWANHLVAPTLNSPADGAITNDLTPTLDFNRISPEPSGLLYQIQADNSGNTFPSPEVDNTQSSSSSSEFAPSSSLAEGTYSWRVGSKSSAADAPSWSAIRTVILDATPPTAPSLITPANGGFTNDQTPLFDWNDATDPNGINRYTIQVSTSSSLSGGAGSSFSSTVINTNIDASPPASQFTPGTNLAAGTYFWHVRARDTASNTGLYGATSSFTIDITLPGAPTLNSPANAATINDNTPTFSWNAVSDPSTPVTYELLVDTENTFSAPLTISEPSLSSPTFTPSSALTDGTYFWKVRAKDGAGNIGAFSTTHSFTIDSTGPTVTASPTTGTFGPAGTSVTLSSESGATIYYTTNGATPTASSTQYSGPISITTTTTLKAIAKDTLNNFGTVMTEVYTIDNTGPTVTADPTTSTFGPSGTSVTLSSLDTDLDTIYYTDDGTTPDNTATEYTSAISISTTTTLKFIGYDTFGNAGPVGTETYTLDNTGPTVTADPTTSTFGPSGTSVTLSSLDTDLDTIYYTDDGTTPDNTATEYTSAISISTTTTLKFIGYDTFGNAGPVGTETYTLDNTGPTVTADPTTSTFGPSGTSVTLSSLDTDLDTIYYTDDGTTPDNTATEYTSAISISTTTTLKFIGYDTFGNAGPVGTETYTLDNTGPTVTADPTTSTFGPSGTSVTLSSLDTDLDTIYYTDDGTTPDNTATEYTSAISISTTTTLKFIGYDTFGNAGPVGTETYTLDNTGPTVTADPTTSTFGPSGTSVTLSSLDTDLDTIYYTDDGTTPDNTATEYTSAISISTTTTLKFIGYDTFGNAGPVGTETYTLDNTGPTVTADPTTSTFGPSGTSVTLSSLDTDLDTIYYTDDGTTPDNTATEYTSAISISTTTTLKFIGYDTFGNAGPVGTETYTLDNTGPTVTADPTTSTFGPSGTSVTLSSLDTDLDTIYYTDDGTTPDNTATEYTSAISISTTTTLKFIGYDTFGNAGPVGTETYTLDNTGPTVTAAPNGGTYASSQSVTLSSESGATIYYTTDGTTPSGSSTVYSSAISISTTTTLKAIAKDTLDNFGDVMTEVYTINTGPVTSDTSLSLQLSGNNKVAAGATFTVSGKLIDAVADSPIAGKTITFTIDGSSVSSVPATVNTDSKGKFTAQLTAPTDLGKHNVQANFAGDSQYNPSSMVKKLTVEGTNTLTTATATSMDTSLSLKVEGNDKMASGSTYSVSGKLIDSVSKKPIADKEITVTTDGGSPKGTDNTNSKGEFDINLKAPDSSGKYDIKAHFAGDSQYKSSDSSVTKITVEGSTLTTQQSTVTTDEQQTDEEQPEEETEEQPEEETEEQPEEETEEPEEEPVEETE